MSFIYVGVPLSRYLLNFFTCLFVFFYVCIYLVIVWTSEAEEQWLILILKTWIISFWWLRKIFTKRPRSSIIWTKLMTVNLEDWWRCWWWIIFCGVVYQLEPSHLSPRHPFSTPWKHQKIVSFSGGRDGLSLISSRDHCSRFSPSWTSHTPRAETTQNLSSDFAVWSCAFVITTTTPQSH